MTPTLSDDFGRWWSDIRFLENELLTMLTHKMLWRKVVDAVGNQKDMGVPALWANHYTMLYINTQAMAVRRVIRGRSQQVSWFSLLRSIASRSEQLTVDVMLDNLLGRAKYVPDAIVQYERQWILDNWFDADGRFLTERVELDRNNLRKATSKVLALADKTIAHLDPSAEYDRPTFDDLDRSIELLTTVQQRYVRLVRGVDTDPTRIQLEAGWTNALAKPLFKSAF